MTKDNATGNVVMEKQNAPEIRSRKGLRWLGISFGVVALFAMAGYMLTGPFSDRINTLTPLVVHNNLRIDMRHPDVLIDSHSLSRLPKDLLSVPLLRDTLTEDFVFYYQNNGDRLGLEGSVRRIVYEHDLKLRDRLLSELLDEPATVALWHDAKGRLSHYVVVIQRGGIARLLEPLAFAVTTDSQLSKTALAELKVEGASVPVYRLNYNGKQSLLFASHGDRLIVLSSPEMMFNGEQQESLSTELTQDLLAGKKPWDAGYGLAARQAAGKENETAIMQRIAISSNYLGFGYQRLFPAFAGVRFEMGKQGWQSFLALNDSHAADDSDFNLTPIWQAMPAGAGFCVALPYSRGIAEEMLKHIAASEAANQLAGQFSGAAGVCWYADSRLYSPLIVGQLNEAGEAQRQALSEVFSQTIGAKERNAPAGHLPVEATEQNGAWRWQREVSSRYGNYSAELSGHADHLMSPTFFRVSLALRGDKVLFSLDDKLVAKGLQTLSKTFPPMSDLLPGRGMVPFYLAPKSLADLLRNEVLNSVPQNLEPIFYNAAQTSLLPKLSSLGGHKSYVVMLPEKTQADKPWQWLPVNWQAL